jgi:hypothetical protein
MPGFRDATGKPWELPVLDCPLIELVRERCSIDLADPSGMALITLERDPVKLLAVLRLLIPGSDSLAAGLRGEALESAFEAARGAVRDFFPRARWSRLESLLTQQKEVEEMRAMFSALAGMPEEAKQAVMEAVRAASDGTIGSEQLTAAMSALGQDGTPSSVLGDLPVMSAVA